VSARCQAIWQPRERTASLGGCDECGSSAVLRWCLTEDSEKPSLSCVLEYQHDSDVYHEAQFEHRGEVVALVRWR
jgi:hypothetical protein